MKIKIPINYTDIFKQTGVRAGNIAKRFGQWSVDNCPDASIAIFDPPYEIGDKTSYGTITDIKICGNCWLVHYEPVRESEE